MRCVKSYLHADDISVLAFAGDGRTPRSSSADYPVHADTRTATIAAVRVSAEQLNKTFPSDFAKKYVVRGGRDLSQGRARPSTSRRWILF